MLAENPSAMKAGAKDNRHDQMSTPSPLSQMLCGRIAVMPESVTTSTLASQRRQVLG